MQKLAIPKSIERYFVEPPASPKLIERTENDLQVKFPPQLREFYLLHNGYENEMLRFPHWTTEEDYQRRKKPSSDGLLGIAMCYDADPLVDFQPTLSIQSRSRISEIPRWLLPIGIATDQSQLCISLRDSDYGCIYLFSLTLYRELNDEEREEDPLAPIFFVSPSLQIFLNSLHQ